MERRSPREAPEGGAPRAQDDERLFKTALSLIGPETRACRACRTPLAATDNFCCRCGTAVQRLHQPDPLSRAITDHAGLLRRKEALRNAAIVMIAGTIPAAAVGAVVARLLSG